MATAEFPEFEAFQPAARAGSIDLCITLGGKPGIILYFIIFGVCVGGGAQHGRPPAAFALPPPCKPARGGQQGCRMPRRAAGLCVQPVSSACASRARGRPTPVQGYQPAPCSPACAGDGTVLHLASLFSEDKPLPPCISFAMGTLGFLTPFSAGMVRLPDSLQ